MTRHNFKPGDFQGIPVDSSGIEFDQDDGFTDETETIETFTGPNMSAGEVWEVTSQLSLNQPPDEGPMYLEFLEEDEGDILARKAIPEGEGLTVQLNAVIPSYIAAGEFSPPADGGLEIYVNNVSGSQVNYFVDTISYRVREAIDENSISQGNDVDDFESDRL